MPVQGSEQMHAKGGGTAVNNNGTKVEVVADGFGMDAVHARREVPDCDFGPDEGRDWQQNEGKIEHPGKSCSYTTADVVSSHVFRRDQFVEDAVLRPLCSPDKPDGNPKQKATSTHSEKNAYIYIHII